MRYKKAIISIAAIVLVTWILISSLSSVPVINSSSSGSGGGSNGGSGSSSGLGSGLGSGFGFNFPTFSFKFPNLNLNLGLIFKATHFHIQWPTFNLTLPPTNLNSAKTNSTSSHPGGGGGNSGHGPSSNVQNKINVIDQILLNPIFLIIIIGIVGAIMAVYLVKNAGKHPRKPRNKKEEAKQEYRETFDSRKENMDDLPSNAMQENRESISKLPNVINLKNFKGWGGNGFIQPDIPVDMPLIWQEQDPLNVNVCKAMEINSTDPKFQGTIGEGRFNVSIGIGLNKIMGQWNDGKEEKDIYGINIWNDAQKQMMGNLGMKLMNALRNNTLREIRGSNEFRNVVENIDDSDKLIRIYERIYYGKKSINIKEYYDFLRYIKNTMKDPKMYM
ncbi:MAG: hypothetical protein ACYCSO_08605 [Cuniculiplasma sp.]